MKINHPTMEHSTSNHLPKYLKRETTGISFEEWIHQTFTSPSDMNTLYISWRVYNSLRICKLKKSLLFITSLVLFACNSAVLVNKLMPSYQFELQHTRCPFTAINLFTCSMAALHGCPVATCDLYSWSIAFLWVHLWPSALDWWFQNIEVFVIVK